MQADNGSPAINCYIPLGIIVANLRSPFSKPYFPTDFWVANKMIIDGRPINHMKVFGECSPTAADARIHGVKGQDCHQLFLGR